MTPAQLAGAQRLIDALKQEEPMLDDPAADVGPLLQLGNREPPRAPAATSPGRLRELRRPLAWMALCVGLVAWAAWRAGR